MKTANKYLKFQNDIKMILQKTNLKSPTELWDLKHFDKHHISKRWSIKIRLIKIKKCKIDLTNDMKPVPLFHSRCCETQKLLFIAILKIVSQTDFK